MCNLSLVTVHIFIYIYIPLFKLIIKLTYLYLKQLTYSSFHLLKVIVKVSYVTVLKDSSSQQQFIWLKALSSIERRHLFTYIVSRSFPFCLQSSFPCVYNMTLAIWHDRDLHMQSDAIALELLEACSWSRDRALFCNA